MVPGTLHIAHQHIALMIIFQHQPLPMGLSCMSVLLFVTFPRCVSPQSKCLMNCQMNSWPLNHSHCPIALQRRETHPCYGQTTPCTWSRRRNGPCDSIGGWVESGRGQGGSMVSRRQPFLKGLLVRHNTNDGAGQDETCGGLQRGCGLPDCMMLAHDRIKHSKSHEA